ncbi:MEMO1 family protein [Candidatus Micrarchaeota archaeon]|nr:MEMO1 family protein [Candidatus Micrarchaeota archaeon]
MRNTAAAGSFYPRYTEELEWALKECFNIGRKNAQETDAYAGICPHAGYIYSGFAAASVFLSIKGIKDAQTVVFLGPNHTGMGVPVSLSKEDWNTPLGVCENDKEFGEAILRHSKMAQKDEAAHAMEHSIEVQLPFLKSLNPKARIVPICMGDQSINAARDIAEAIFLSQKELGRKTILIASSDFSHYVPAETAEERDRGAISHILKLDAEGLEEGVERNGWSICGHGPIAASIIYSKKRGSKKAMELIYTNSGEATGDYSSVVAYCGIIFPG